MEVVRKRLDELHIPEKNVRRHTDKQLKEYVRSLNMFGQIKPIVIDEAGEIIAGNGLFMALQQMGAEECDCYVLSGLSDKQKKKLMLADNRVYELGITDMDAFDAIIKELQGDIDVPGWDDELLAMMNSASRDVDDMVNNYGSYDETDVNRLAERKKEPLPSAQMSAATVPAEKTAAPVQEQRIVVCPKCGERICL